MLLVFSFSWIFSTICCGEQTNPEDRVPVSREDLETCAPLTMEGVHNLFDPALEAVYLLLLGSFDRMKEHDLLHVREGDDDGFDPLQSVSAVIEAQKE